MFYVPLAQNVNYKDDLMPSIELRSHFVRGIMLVTDMKPGVLEPLVTKALAGVDPNLTITSVRTMEEQVALSFDRERAVASLAGLFGIRMALGADRAKVVRMVLRGVSNRVLIGLAAGVPLAIGAGRLISAELYGVSSWDPFALIVATGALSVCAFFAALIPAGRAASISPTNALRSE